MYEKYGEMQVYRASVPFARAVGCDFKLLQFAPIYQMQNGAVHCSAN